MERLTKQGPDGEYYLERDTLQLREGVYTGEGAERLARFEDACLELLERQRRTACELERLRGEGKGKTARFSDLLRKKIIHAALLTLLQTHGLRYGEEEVGGGETL